MKPDCPYCGGEAQLVTGAELYSHRSDLDHKKFWRCAPCKAWVGCHGTTDTPLGRLANAELRAWKAKAHAAFDPLWQRKMELEGISKKKARGAGYAWLGRELGLGADECHIGLFDVATCKRVIELCARPPKRLSEDTNRETSEPSRAHPRPKHPRVPMQRVCHFKGRGSYGYVYRGVEQPRLIRIDTYTKRPRTLTTTWLVDNTTVASVDEALTRLGVLHPTDANNAEAL